jgi:hypothetical protein
VSAWGGTEFSHYTIPMIDSYLEAIRNLQAQGKRFARTIHVVFVPGICIRRRIID